jgi:hypothetical protein
MAIVFAFFTFATLLTFVAPILPTILIVTVTIVGPTIISESELDNRRGDHHRGGRVNLRLRVVYLRRLNVNRRGRRHYDRRRHRHGESETESDTCLGSSRDPQQDSGKQ